jgi:hypothetical protein
VLIGSFMGAVAFTSATYFGTSMRGPLVLALAAGAGLVLGAVVGFVNESAR